MICSKGIAAPGRRITNRYWLLVLAGPQSFGGCILSQDEPGEVWMRRANLRGRIFILATAWTGVCQIFQSDRTTESTSLRLQQAIARFTWARCLNGAWGEKLPRHDDPDPGAALVGC